MTARLIRFDESYTELINDLVAKSDGHIELVDDPNLRLDPYFYERKASLEKTIKAIDDGTMKMISQEEWDLEMELLDRELEEKYGNN